MVHDSHTGICNIGEYILRRDDGYEEICTPQKQSGKHHETMGYVSWQITHGKQVEYEKCGKYRYEYERPYRTGNRNKRHRQSRQSLSSE